MKLSHWQPVEKWITCKWYQMESTASDRKYLEIAAVLFLKLANHDSLGGKSLPIWTKGLWETKCKRLAFPSCDEHADPGDTMVVSKNGWNQHLRLIHPFIYLCLYAYKTTSHNVMLYNKKRLFAGGKKVTVIILSPAVCISSAPLPPTPPPPPVLPVSMWAGCL